jgi:D-aminopeptidase
VVGETNDGWLNDIRALPVTGADVVAAIEAAASGPVEEGSVGAGAGTRALGWKGGIGTASRRLPERLGGWTVGALVQTNFGGVLRIDGVPVGEALGRYSFKEELATAPPGEASGAAAAESPADPGGPAEPGGEPSRETASAPAVATALGAAGAGDPGAAAGAPGEDRGGGSCMIVLATDAPLSSRNLERLASRSALALGRVGSFVGDGSGDFVIAFTTAERIPHGGPPVRTVERLANDAMSPLFLAAVEAVEEAIYNSLLRAETVTGFQGRTVEAIPVDAVRELLGRHGALAGGR